MSVLFSNNALTVLAAAVGQNEVTSTITVATGAGQRFAAPTNGDYQVITLSDPLYTRFEICHLTARTGDTLTVLRGQEGTTKQAWDVGDRIYASFTASTVGLFLRADTPASISGLWDFSTPPLINGNNIWHSGNVTPADRTKAQTISGLWTFTTLPKFNAFNFVTTQGATMVGPFLLYGSPTQDNEAATKLYVDNLAAGLHDKEAVVAASTDAGGNVNITSAPSTLDGVTLVAGNRILLKNQTNKTQNLIYVFNAVGQPLTAASDSDETGDLKAGSTVFVTGGTVNKNSRWTVITTDPITIGTTPIEWTQTSGAGQIRSGPGIKIIGDQISADVPSAGGLTVSVADGIGLSVMQDLVVNTGAATAGTTGASLRYNSITVDKFGRVVNATNLPYALTTGAVFTGALTRTSTPSSGNDITTVDFVQNAIVSISTMRQPVAAVATSNVSLSGLGFIDGYQVKLGERVLVAGQTTQTANGVYVTTANAWVRASDFNSTSSLAAGVMFPVQNGTTFKNQIFMLSTQGTISIGTTPITFQRVTGTGLINKASGGGIDIVNDSIGLETQSGLTAGTYNTARVTVNSKGIITGIEAGSSGVTSFNGRSGVVMPATNDYTFAMLGGKPTTLAGYGITDPVMLRTGGTITGVVSIDYGNPAATDGPYPLLFMRLTEGERNTNKVGMNIIKEDRNSWAIAAVAGSDVVNITNGSKLNLRFQTAMVNDAEILTDANFDAWTAVAFSTGNTTRNAVARGCYMVDTTSLAGTLVLPSNPAPGTAVRVLDAGGTFGTKNLTISRNNARIVGALEDLVLDKNNGGVTLVYYNAARGWVPFFS